MSENKLTTKDGKVFLSKIASESGINVNFESIAAEYRLLNPFVAPMWLGSAYTSMEEAVRLDVESGRRLVNSGGHINHFKLHIAHLLAGYAFELVYKALSVIEFVPIQKTHLVKKLHENLNEKIQKIIENWAKEKGWKNAANMLEYIDNRLTAPNRKYWDMDPWIQKKRVLYGTAIADSNMTIPELSRIFAKLCDLAHERYLEQIQKYDEFLAKIEQTEDVTMKVLARKIVEKGGYIKEQR